MFAHPLRACRRETIMSMESFYRAIEGRGSCLGLVFGFALLIFISGLLYTFAGHVGSALGNYLDRFGFLGDVAKNALVVLFIVLVLWSSVRAGKKRDRH